MNWGKWIILSFVLFAAFIGILVTICIRQDMGLVSMNYYQEELAYQQQIERMNNTNGLTERPTITMKGNTLEIEFDQFINVERGELRLFRPSDARLDKEFILQPSAEKARRFDVRSLPKGMYRVKMQWSMNGKEYFMEDIINL